jgi:hypothetical protein
MVKAVGAATADPDSKPYVAAVETVALAASASSPCCLDISSDSGSSDSSDPVSRKARKYLAMRAAMRAAASNTPTDILQPLTIFQALASGQSFANDVHEHGGPAASMIPHIVGPSALVHDARTDIHPYFSQFAGCRRIVAGIVPVALAGADRLDLRQLVPLEAHPDSDSSCASSSSNSTCQDPHENGGPVNIMNLWKAVPQRYYNRYADITATHASDEDKCSASSDTDRELTPGFVSDQDDAVDGTVNAGDMAILAKILPLTARATRDAQMRRK